MFQYVVRRIVTAVPVVFFVAVIAFALIRLAAGNPAVVFLGPSATDEDIALITRQLGLDQPIPVQFGIWIGNLARGDLGNSFFLGRDVATAIWERMPATLLLTSAGLFFALLTGIPAGVAAAVRHNGWVDRAIMVLTLVGVSVPVFWIGLMLAWVFGVQLRWFPTGGYVPITEDFFGGLRYIVLPGVALGALHASLITRITRASMLDVLRQDYIRTAHAKGLQQPPIVFGHALRNALIPTITVIGSSIGALLSGVVIIETVFTYPGIGRLVVSAVQQRDYNVVQGSLLIVAVLYVTINLLVDISYSLIDPRIRYD